MRVNFVLAALLAALLFCAGVHPAQAALSQAELKPALEELLKEHPEVLLNFLREHSEAVLDAAQQGSEHRRLAGLEKQWASDVKVEKKVATRNRPRVGSEKAKVQIVAFSDFTCHYCFQAQKVVDAILREYAGKVSLVFKCMPMDNDGVGALSAQYFVAISMQSQELAWKFYRMMFDRREDLLTKGEAFLRSAAEEIGVDMKKMDSARRQKSLAALLKEDLKDADSLKVEGTPFFLVNNLVIRGSVPLPIFRRAVDIELAR